MSRKWHLPSPLRGAANRSITSSCASRLDPRAELRLAARQAGLPLDPAGSAAQAAAVAEIAVIADVPIGLPDGGRRQADLLAREAVGRGGGRRS
jgi:hypothetical protein